MTREIKFRAWSKYAESMYSWEEIENSSKSYLYQSFQDAEESGYTFMQYTGLKDKNGKEIYSGDILEYGGARNEVKYITELAMYDDIFGLRFASLAGQSEVVGNIYENPELFN